MESGRPDTRLLQHFRQQMTVAQNIVASGDREKGEVMKYTKEAGKNLLISQKLGEKKGRIKDDT